MKAILSNLAAHWIDAARMVASALIAFVVSGPVLHLPETMWAVLSALIVSRPDVTGALKSSLGRLLGTVLGAGIAVAAAFVAELHLPEIVLLALVLIPTSLLAAVNRDFRTAPIAALIVLSSGAVAGGSPVTTALFRTIEITIGSLASLAVTYALRPRSSARPLARVVGVMPDVGRLLAILSGREKRPAGTWETVRTTLRGELRELAGYAASAARAEDRERVQQALRAVTAIQTDILLVAHARRKARAPIEFGPVADAFSAVVVALPALAREATAGARTRARQAIAAFRMAVDATAAGAGEDTTLWTVLLGHLADDVEALGRLLLGADGETAP